MALNGWVAERGQCGGTGGTGGLKGWLKRKQMKLNKRKTVYGVTK